MNKPLRTAVVIMSLLLAAVGQFASAGDAPPRLDREKLLEYRDASGNVRPVESVGDWLRRRAEIVAGMQQVMGPLPGKDKRCPFDVRVEEETDCGDYVRRLITYAAEPDSRVPAYLLIPKSVLETEDAKVPVSNLPSSDAVDDNHRKTGANTNPKRKRGTANTNPKRERGTATNSTQTNPSLALRVGVGRTARPKKAPAVLCLHPTDDKIGHKVVVGLGGRPNRQYAQELAQRGYVTLAPSYPLLANYQPDLDALGYQSGTMKAIWDNIRGIDLLESLPYVDHEVGVGAIGHSLGGHNAVYTAVFDDRIKAVVTSCGLDSYLDYKDGNIEGWTSTRYMPKLLEYRDNLAAIPFDFHEMIAALAPRHCFISAPLHDSNFKWDSVDVIAKSAASIYKLYDVEDHLSVEHPDCDHDFPDEMRAKAYRLFDKVLRGKHPANP